MLKIFFYNSLFFIFFFFSEPLLSFHDFSAPFIGVSISFYETNDFTNKCENLNVTSGNQVFDERQSKFTPVQDFNFRYSLGWEVVPYTMVGIEIGKSNYLSREFFKSNDKVFDIISSHVAATFEKHFKLEEDKNIFLGVFGGMVNIHRLNTTLIKKNNEGRGFLGNVHTPIAGIRAGLALNCDVVDFRLNYVLSVVPNSGYNLMAVHGHPNVGNLASQPSHVYLTDLKMVSHGLEFGMLFSFS